MKTDTTQRDIPSGWQLVPFGKHIKLQGGNAFSAANYVTDGVPLVRIGNVGKGEFVSKDFVYLSEQEYKDNEAVHLKDGDILMGMTGELGKVARINKKSLPAALNQRVGRVVFKDKEIEPDFTYQTFLSPDFISKLEKFFIGAAQKNISSNQVESVEIALPPIKEQQKIAEILGTVDEGIAKTQEVIEMTEKLKRGLMQQLFTRGIAHTKFKETKIGDICDVFTGGTPSTSKEEYWDGDIPWMSSGEVNNKFIKSVEKRITEVGLRSSNARMLPVDTVMVALAGQGKTRGTVAILEMETTCNQSLAGIVVKDKKQTYSKYIFYNLESRYQELRNINGSEGRAGLNLRIIKDFVLPLPSYKEQYEIAEILSAIDEKILVNKKLKERLTLLKKGLMQDLLSGKVRTNI